MNFFKNEHLVNAPESFAKLAEWEKAADPTVRFENNFYTLQRFAFMHDYAHMMEISTEPDDEAEARSLLDSNLEKLRATYIADLELLFEMQMTLQNIFIPWRVKLQPVAEM